MGERDQLKDKVVDLEKKVEVVEAKEKKKDDRINEKTRQLDEAKAEDGFK